VKAPLVALHLPAVTVLLQPIVALETLDVVAAEALARPVNDIGVLDLLDDARAQGIADAAEAHLLRHALAARTRLPAECLLCLNVTADALTGREAFEQLDRLGSLAGLVLELRQERDWHEDELLMERIEGLRDRGALLALDDAAQGFQGLLAISRLRPDWVKVDRSIVTGAKDDAVRRAGLDMFAASAARAGSALVAEGVETEDDLEVLGRVGVTLAQGYLFSPPVPGPVPTTVRVAQV